MQKYLTFDFPFITFVLKQNAHIMKNDESEKYEVNREEVEETALRERIVPRQMPDYGDTNRFPDGFLRKKHRSAGKKARKPLLN